MIENYNVFKGIKQVFESTYTALTNSQKEGYLWFVRKDSAATVGDIHFGSKQYSEVDTPIPNATIDAIWDEVMTNGELNGEFTLVTGLTSNSDITAYLVQYLGAFVYVTPNTGNTQYDTSLIIIGNNNMTWGNYNAPVSSSWNDNIVGHTLKLSNWGSRASYEDGNGTELTFVYDATTGKIYASDGWEEEEEEE